MQNDAAADQQEVASQLGPHTAGVGVLFPCLLRPGAAFAPCPAASLRVPLAPETFASCAPPPLQPSFALSVPNLPVVFVPLPLPLPAPANAPSRHRAPIVPEDRVVGPAGQFAKEGENSAWHRCATVAYRERSARLPSVAVECAVGAAVAEES